MKIQLSLDNWNDTSVTDIAFLIQDMVCVFVYVRYKIRRWTFVRTKLRLVNWFTDRILFWVDWNRSTLLQNYKLNQCSITVSLRTLCTSQHFGPQFHWILIHQWVYVRVIYWLLLDFLELSFTTCKCWCNSSDLMISFS